MSHIFISYNRADKAYALKLGDKLRHEGFDVWLDVVNISAGDEWWPTIEQAVLNCAAFLVVMTPASAQSPWVRDEIAIARYKQKPIFPLLLRGDVFLSLLSWQATTVTDERLPPADFYDELARFAPRKAIGQGEAVAPQQINIYGDVHVVGGVIGSGTVQAEHIAGRDVAIQDEPASVPVEAPLPQPEPPQGSYWSFATLLALITVAGIVLVLVLRISGVLPAPWLINPLPTDSTPQNAQATGTAGALTLTALAVTMQFPPQATAIMAGATETVRAGPLLTATAVVARATQTAQAGPLLTATAVVAGATQTAQAERVQAIARAWEGVSSNSEWTPYSEVINDIEYVLVPGGCFRMGNDPDANYSYDSEFAQGVPDGGQQCLDDAAPFWISRTEITNAQYQQCVDAEACEPNTQYDGFTNPQQPVVGVDWFDASAFAAWVAARLPREDQWEYAARGPDGLEYSWGNEPPTCALANYWGRENGCIGATSTVGFYSRSDNDSSGDSWVGAADMAGNVWEWTTTIYRDYPYNARDGREDVSNSSALRATRGGSWYSDEDQTLAASRLGWNPDYGSNYIGFRVVLTAPVE